MRSTMMRSLAEHAHKSIRYYRLTVYLVAGVAITTAFIPFTHNSPSAAALQQKDAITPIKDFDLVAVSIGLHSFAAHPTAGICWARFPSDLNQVAERRCR
jgi:hypothetical protein